MVCRNERVKKVKLKDDFVPGGEVLLYDDFSDMQPDEAPPHWKVRGGAVVLKEGGGVREAELTGRQNLVNPLLKGFPKNFTIETAKIVLSDAFLSASDVIAQCYRW